MNTAKGQRSKIGKKYTFCSRTLFTAEVPQSSIYNEESCVNELWECNIQSINIDYNVCEIELSMWSYGRPRMTQNMDMDGQNFYLKIYHEYQKMVLILFKVS